MYSRTSWAATPGRVPIGASTTATGSCGQSVLHRVRCETCLWDEGRACSRVFVSLASSLDASDSRRLPVQAASSEAPEQSLARRFAKAASADEMLNVHDLKADYEKAIGHATQRSTVYNLLHRHGMAQGDAAPIISQA